MKPTGSKSRVFSGLAAYIPFLFCILATWVTAQTPVERQFSQSKSNVEKSMELLRGEMSGHLPTLEGFAISESGSLSHYSRGYYEATVQVRATPSGGSLVAVSIQVTAWYRDPASSTSGYRVLKSNGRIESDILDQLAEQLAKTSEPAAAPRAQQKTPVHQPTSTDTSVSAPNPASASSSALWSSMNQSLATEERAARTTETPAKDSEEAALRSEAANLEEILKNQAHPQNLVAVKKSGTPVVATPSLSAKPQFLASMHDEFEMLDYNADWVHVRISGLSRGWIWRNSVEMPEGIPNNDTATSASSKPVADLFNVIREETAPFPGDWAPLHNKNVKIITVQKADEKAREGSGNERLEYARFLFEKNYPELSRKSQEVSGIVVIFDSSDGGMVAATSPDLEQWKAGTLSDAALWHKCFFDPPETFDSRSPQAAQ